MKTFFIVVSLLAASYLAAQTNWAKSVAQSFWQQNDTVTSSVGENSTMFNDVIEESAAINEAQSNVAKQILQVEARNNKQWDTAQKEISDLQQEVSNLKLVIAENTALAKEFGQINLKQQTSAAVKIDSVITENHNQKDLTLLPQTQSTFAENNAFTNVKPEQSEQQKRLQQQAILRELSQKMELAALTSLAK